MNKIKTNSHVSSSLFDPDIALAKGTIFKKLYKPYKVDPNMPIPSNEEEKLMLDIQKYAIGVIDLSLVLDIYPDDSTMLRLYDEYLTNFNNAKEKYKKKYGSLEKNSDDVLKQNKWLWDNNNWPWMREE